MSAIRKGEEMGNIFDTLEYAEKAEKVGFTKEQASFQAREMAKVIDEKLATKKDLKALEIAVRNDIKELELRLIIKMGAMVTVITGLMTTLIKLT
jgi:hypothetical protein